LLTRTPLLLTSQQCEIFSGEWLKCSAQAFLFLIPGTIKAFVYWTGEYPLFPLGLQQTLVNCFGNPLSICKMNNTVVINLITVSVQALGHQLVDFKYNILFPSLFPCKMPCFLQIFLSLER
jgi:hypothetical protein